MTPPPPPSASCAPLASSTYSSSVAQTSYGVLTTPSARSDDRAMICIRNYGNGVGGLRPGPHCFLNSTSPHRDVLLLTYLHTCIACSLAVHCGAGRGHSCGQTYLHPLWGGTGTLVRANIPPSIESIESTFPTYKSRSAAVIPESPPLSSTLPALHSADLSAP